MGIKKRIGRITTMILAVIVAFSFSAGTVSAETENDTKTAVTIIDADGNTVKAYTLEELEAIAKKEGDKAYTFSTSNSNPTYEKEENVKGPMLKSVLEDAGITLRDDQYIELAAKDGYGSALTKAQLEEKRYYYPNGAAAIGNGKAAPKDSYNGKVEVPVILGTSDETDEPDGKKSQWVGQTAPNEYNRPSLVTGLLNDGRISIKNNIGTLPAIAEASQPTGAVVASGEKITFTGGNNGKENLYAPQEAQIYYTMDGTDPGPGSAIYNCKKDGSINPPVISGEKGDTVTVKVKVVGWGKNDSPVSTFTYYVGEAPVEPPAAPVLSSVKGSSYNSIKLTWEKVTGASGYVIYRYDNKTGKYVSVKSVTGTSYTNKGLKTGTTYKYKINAYRTVSGKTVYSEYSAVKSATPTLAAASISKVKGGKKSVTVRWKKVSGASGYQIYRAVSKNGKYKLVKTVKKGKTVSWKNVKLKKGKNYYYKIKAYRTVDKKKVYSKFSSVRSAKAR